MTATGRKAPPDPLGRYYTPEPLAYAMAQRAVGMEGQGKCWLDPSCGSGRLLDALDAVDSRSYTFGTDIDPAAGRGGWAPCDALAQGALLRDTFEPDAILANPPYSVNRKEVASEHLLAYLQIAPVVYMLVPCTFFFGVRAPRFGNDLPIPTDTWGVYPRPSFSGDGRTEANEYVFARWERGLNPRAPSGPRWQQPALVWR